MDYIRAFLAGGVICALVQILMEKQNDARPYYGPFSSIRCDFRCHRYLRALQRMGRSRRQRSSLRLWKHPVAGGEKAVGEDGILGAFKGGLTVSSGGITAALVFGYLASLVFKPKMK